MLKEILSISGRPGLYKLISHGKNMMIVESLIDKKRMPALAHDRVVSLGDISIYTDSGEKPLNEILKAIKEKEQGGKCSIDSKADGPALRDYLAQIVPDFDQERVHTSDIKKIVIWYNLLIENSLTDFEIAEENKETAE
jgi:hypothetical protein